MIWGSILLRISLILSMTPKVIALDYGSSWVVDDLDKYTAELWAEFAKVVVIDDEMYKLDEAEKAMVTPDFDRTFMLLLPKN